MEEEIKPQEADKLPKNTIGIPFTKDDPRINRAGRPKGKTIKERVRQWLEEHPDDMQAFVEHFVKENRDLAWQMMEGRPKEDVKLEGNLIINIEKEGAEKYGLNSNTETSPDGQSPIQSS
jgi:hypothetical protein